MGTPGVSLHELLYGMAKFVLCEAYSFLCFRESVADSEQLLDFDMVSVCMPSNKRRFCFTFEAFARLLYLSNVFSKEL